MIGSKVASSSTTIRQASSNLKDGSRNVHAARPRPTKVLLSGLPLTASPTDIRLLAFKTDISPRAKNPQPNPQNTVISKDPTALSSSMYNISFLRSKHLNPLGSAVATFHDADRAQEFVEIANRRAMGGHTIRAALTTADNLGDTSQVVKVLSLLQQQSPGRVVLMKGLPQHLESFYVKRMLQRQYHLAQDTISWPDHKGNERTLDSVFKIVNLGGQNFNSSFLIRLATVADANMLVRRWHRTVYDTRFGVMRRHTIKREEGREAEEAKFDINENEEEDFEGDEDLTQDDTSFREKWRSKLRNTWETENPGQGEGIRCVVDAYLMH